MTPSLLCSHFQVRACRAKSFGAPSHGPSLINPHDVDRLGHVSGERPIESTISKLGAPSDSRGLPGQLGEPRRPESTAYPKGDLGGWGDHPTPSQPRPCTPPVERRPQIHRREARERGIGNGPGVSTTWARGRRRCAVVEAPDVILPAPACRPAPGGGAPGWRKRGPHALSRLQRAWRFPVALCLSFGGPTALEHGGRFLQADKVRLRLRHYSQLSALRWHPKLSLSRARARTQVCSSSGFYASRLCQSRK